MKKINCNKNIIIWLMITATYVSMQNLVIILIRIFGRKKNLNLTKEVICLNNLDQN